MIVTLNETNSEHISKRHILTRHFAKNISWQNNSASFWGGDKNGITVRLSVNGEIGVRREDITLAARKSFSSWLSGCNFCAWRCFESNIDFLPVFFFLMFAFHGWSGWCSLATVLRTGTKMEPRRFRVMLWTRACNMTKKHTFAAFWPSQKQRTLSVQFLDIFLCVMETIVRVQRLGFMCPKFNRSSNLVWFGLVRSDSCAEALSTISGIKS